MSNTAERKNAKENSPKTTTATASNPTAKKSTDTASTPQWEQELKQAKEIAKRATEDAVKAQKEAEEAKRRLEQAKPLNVVDAMARIYSAKEVLSRLEFLRDTQKSLSEFTLGRSGVKDEVKITDGTGHIFQTTNTDTVKTVLETLRNELDKKIADTEAELMGLV